jgi:Transient receptor potential (TRP) ion channel
LTGIASLGSLGSAAGPNSGAAQSPNFADVLQWFQFIAFSGMYSVNYPPIYRSFCKNFGWSTGLVSWGALERSIDNFRAHTGGNLTDMNYNYLLNATLVYQAPTMQKRALDVGFGNSSVGNTAQSGPSHVVSGISAFAESLLIPSAKYLPRLFGLMSVPF